MLSFLSSDPRNLVQYFSSLYRTAVAGAVVLVLCGSCRTVPEPPPLTYSSESRPVFCVVYHPYGPGLDRGHSSPVPEYAGWSDERMIRDLSRFQDIGIGLIFISVNNKDMANSLYRDRLRRFFSYAGEIDSGLSLSILVTSPYGTSTKSCEKSVALFADWLLSTGLNSSSAFFRGMNRPLILLGPNIDSALISHPAFTFRRTNGNAGAWSLVPYRRVSSPAGPEGQIAVFPRQPSPPPKSFFRRTPSSCELRADALRSDIWRAFQLEAKYIVIDSWNDFSSGRYVEPDRLYGSSCLEVLSEEIARVRVLP